MHCKGIRPSYIRCPLGIKKPNGLIQVLILKMKRTYAMQKFHSCACLFRFLSNINDTDAHNFFGKGLHPRDLVTSSIFSTASDHTTLQISTAEGSRTKGQDDITIHLQEINRRAK